MGKQLRQTAGWIKMPLGTDVGLSPGDIVLDRWGSISLTRGTAPSPTFRPMSTLAKRLDGSRWCRGRPGPRPHCIRWAPSSSSERGIVAPSSFGSFLLWPNGRPFQLLLSKCCTTHSRVSSGMPGHVFSPKNCPFVWGWSRPTPNARFTF